MDLLDTIDAALITNATNIRYLTGFVGADSNAREANLLITGNGAYFFTNTLYIERARSLMQDKTRMKLLDVIETSSEQPIAYWIKKLATKHAIKTMGYEDTNLTVYELNKLKKRLGGLSLSPTRGRIEKLREIKSTEELRSIKEACTIADACYSHILKNVRTGMTELEVAWQIESSIREKNAQLAFSPIVAFGSGSSQPHYEPTDKKLSKKDELVLFDLGAEVEGYKSDMTRVVFTKATSGDVKKAYDAVLRAQEEALDYLGQQNSHLEGVQSEHLPGENLSGSAADQMARDVIEEAGFTPYAHSLGHCVGLDIHEKPRLTIKNDAQLTPGMVFSVEPGIYEEGAYGIRIEDLVHLRKDGIEVLTRSDKTATVLTTL